MRSTCSLTIPLPAGSSEWSGLTWSSWSACDPRGSHQTQMPVAAPGPCSPRPRRDADMCADLRHYSGVLKPLASRAARFCTLVLSPRSHPGGRRCRSPTGRPEDQTRPRRHRRKWTEEVGADGQVVTADGPANPSPPTAPTPPGLRHGCSAGSIPPSSRTPRHPARSH